MLNAGVQCWMLALQAANSPKGLMELEAPVTGTDTSQRELIGLSHARRKPAAAQWPMALDESMSRRISIPCRGNGVADLSAAKLVVCSRGVELFVCCTCSRWSYGVWALSVGHNDHNGGDLESCSAF